MEQKIDNFYTIPMSTLMKNIVINHSIEHTFLRYAEAAYLEGTSSDIESFIGNTTHSKIKVEKCDLPNEYCRVFLARLEEENTVVIGIRGTVLTLGSLGVKGNLTDDLKVLLGYDYNELEIVKHTERFIAEALREGLIKTTDRVVVVGHSLAAPVTMIMAARHHGWEAFGFDSIGFSPKNLEQLKKEPYFDETRLYTCQATWNFFNTWWSVLPGTVDRVILNAETMRKVIEPSSLFIPVPCSDAVVDLLGLELALSQTPIGLLFSPSTWKIIHKLDDIPTMDLRLFTTFHAITMNLNALSDGKAYLIRECDGYYYRKELIPNTPVNPTLSWMQEDNISVNHLFIRDAFREVYTALAADMLPKEQALPPTQRQQLAEREDRNRKLDAALASMNSATEQAEKYFEEKRQQAFKQELALQLLSPSHFSSDMRANIEKDAVYQDPIALCSAFSPPRDIRNLSDMVFVDKENFKLTLTNWWMKAPDTDESYLEKSITLSPFRAMLFAFDLIQWLRRTPEQKAISQICDLIESSGGIRTLQKTQNYFEKVEKGQFSKSAAENEAIKKMFRKIGFNPDIVDYVRAAYVGNPSETYKNSIKRVLHDKLQELCAKALMPEGSKDHPIHEGGALSSDDHVIYSKLKQMVFQKTVDPIMARKMLQLAVELEPYRNIDPLKNVLLKKMAESSGCEREKAIQEYYRLEAYRGIESKFNELVYRRGTNGYVIEYVKPESYKTKKNTLYLYLVGNTLKYTIITLNNCEWTEALKGEAFHSIKQKLQQSKSLRLEELILVINHALNKKLIKEYPKKEEDTAAIKKYYYDYKEIHPNIKRKYLDYCIQQQPEKAIPLLQEQGTRYHLNKAIELLRQQHSHSEADKIMYNILEKEAYFEVQSPAIQQKNFVKAAKILQSIPYCSRLIECTRTFFYQEMHRLEQMGQYQKASVLGELLLSTLKDDETEETYRCRRWLANVYFKLGNYDTVTSLLKMMIDHDSASSFWNNEKDLFREWMASPSARQESIDAYRRLSDFIQHTQSSREILPCSLRQNIHTLFGSGYQFSMTRRDHELTIQAVLPQGSIRSDNALLDRVEKDFIRAISTSEQQSGISSQGNHCWSVQSSHPGFIAQMNQELQSVVTDYQKNKTKVADERTNDELCRMM